MSSATDIKPIDFTSTFNTLIDLRSENLRIEAEHAERLEWLRDATRTQLANLIQRANTRAEQLSDLAALLTSFVGFEQRAQLETWAQELGLLALRIEDGEMADLTVDGTESAYTSHLTIADHHIDEIAMPLWLLFASDEEFTRYAELIQQLNALETAIQKRPSLADQMLRAIFTQENPSEKSVKGTITSMGDESAAQFAADDARRTELETDLAELTDVLEEKYSAYVAP